MAWLGQRYRVHFDPGMFQEAGFLAGDDARRIAELNEALADSETAAIVAARGGYGLGRIVQELALDALLDAPKWVVGFSDLTALHIEVARVGLMSLHAHNAAGLGPADEATRRQWLSGLEQPDRTLDFRGLETLAPGRAEGRLYGGNLTVLFAAHAAGRCRIPEHSVLLLEDIGEASYRIDRMLTALIQSGALAMVSAVVLGEFTACSAGKYEVPTSSVLRERLALLEIPVLGGLPVGHGALNAPLPLGAIARVDATRGELRIDP
jgi:muramoyltetrapeptide carboxypeptidase